MLRIETLEFVFRREDARLCVYAQSENAFRPFLFGKHFKGQGAWAFISGASVSFSFGFSFKPMHKTKKIQKHSLPTQRTKLQNPDPTRNEVIKEPFRIVRVALYHVYM